MGAHPTYSLDTSGILDGLERFYPEYNFPAVWTRMEALVVAGRLVCSEEVLVDARKKDLLAKAWCEKYLDHGLIVPTDRAVTDEVRKVIEKNERLAMEGSTRNRSDPFVIAVARLRNAVVVTGESKGTPRHPKIPFVCAQLGIESISLTDLIKREGWRFGEA